MKTGGKHLIDQVLKTLARAGHRARPLPTEGPGTASRLARQSIEAGADLVLAFGGDGTINEVAGGMIGSQTPLGILPGGTANVLCRELGLGISAQEAAGRLDGCQPERISVGVVRCEGMPPRYFLAMAGIGLDAHIVYRLKPELKQRWGKLAYWISGFGQLGRKLEEFEAEIDGRVYRCSFALVTKVKNYGGDLQIARRVSILDDEFEIVLFAGQRSMRYLKYLTGIAANRLEGMRGVTILRASKARFSAASSDRIHVQIDGEYAGRLPGSVEIAADALTLLTPSGYCRVRPAVLHTSNGHSRSH